MAQKSRRYLNWGFLVYPDSAPEDWRTRLNELQVGFAVSPLHDLDVNEGTGELKKAHFHVVISFPSVKSYEQVCELISCFNGPIPQPVNSLRGAIEYLWHKNNPEKHQYSADEVVVGGGLDIDNILKPTATERYELIDEMIQFVDSTDVVEFKDLMDYARLNRREWFKVLCDSGTFVLREYIKSNRHRNRIDRE